LRFLEDRLVVADRVLPSPGRAVALGLSPSRWLKPMDHSEDVERLFSWLKAPQVHYREFAPQRELAEAVATWPLVHRAAVQTGVAAADEPAPEGDTAAKERILRDRMTLPAQPLQQVVAAPAATQAEEPAAETAPQTPAATRAEAAYHEPDETPIGPAPAAPPHETSEPAIAGFERPAAAPPRAPPAPAERYEPRRAEPAQHYPSPGRGALFSGEYRARERARPAAAVADRQDRSLDAVFSRLGGGRDRLPDPRARARTSPGLGPVFNRLR
jgi:hypothetical protein